MQNYQASRWIFTLALILVLAACSGKPTEQIKLEAGNYIAVNKVEFTGVDTGYIYNTPNEKEQVAEMLRGYILTGLHKQGFIVTKYAEDMDKESKKHLDYILDLNIALLHQATGADTLYGSTERTPISAQIRCTYIIKALSQTDILHGNASGTAKKLVPVGADINAERIFMVAEAIEEVAVNIVNVLVFEHSKIAGAAPSYQEQEDIYYQDTPGKRLAPVKSKKK